MNRKEKSWFIVAVISVVLALVYFVGVLIWLETGKPDKAKPQDFPPVEIVEKDQALDFSCEKVETELSQFLGVFTLTAYCSCEKCCGEWAYNRPVDDMGNEIVIGASGYRLVSNVSVAVDPAVIPYGTELEIDGKTYIAHDCGGAVKGNRIDVYFADHKEALNFGVKRKMVYMGGVVA